MTPAQVKRGFVRPCKHCGSEDGCDCCPKCGDFYVVCICGFIEEYQRLRERGLLN